MSELVALGPHVASALLVGGLNDRHSFVDAKAVPLESDHLARIVGDWTDRLETKVEQNLRADAVLAQIGLEPELLVGLHRVGPAILKLVCLELVEEADAPPFLVEIDDDPLSVGRDELHRFHELPAAVAAERMEDVAGETLRVHPDERVFTRAKLAEDERDVLVVIDVVAVADDAPLAMFGRQPRFGHAMDEPLGFEAVRPALRDRDEGDLVLGGELLEPWTLRRGSVFARDLARHPGGPQRRAPIES